MNKDRLKQVGEKVDLYTVLRRRKFSVASFLIQNQIQNTKDLKEFENEFLISDLFLTEANQHWQKAVEVLESKEEPLEESIQEETNGTNKPSKRKKA